MLVFVLRATIMSLNKSFNLSALAAIVSVIAYVEFENIIEVDRDRNVIFDFGV